MSNALAIASVSAVLVDLLNDGMIDNDVTTTVGAVKVSALPPDRIDTTGTNQQSRLNLYLYRTTPNPGWRNMGLPSRDGAGERVDNPPLALDLHYLLIAYGASDFHGEILLGHGVQILHETPVLAREAVRRSLAPVTPVAAGGGLPAELRALASSELADQMEQIKIVPEALSTEETSKLWTAFQSSYRPSAGYMATVVLIESRTASRPALPVRRRLLRVLPLERPVIDRLLSKRDAAGEARADQAIFDTSSLVLEGQSLRGEDTRVDVGGIEVTPAASDLSETRIRVPVPAGLEAGVQGVQVVHRLVLGSPPVAHSGVESNLEAFVLRPRITTIAVQNPQGTGPILRSADVRLTVAPALGDRQRVVLSMNELNPPANAAPRAYRFTAPPRIPSSPPTPADQVTIPIQGVRAGAYLFRLQVNGAESELTVDAQGRFDGPQETIP